VPPLRFEAAVPDGVLAGVRAGTGEPLLVLHGGPGTSDYTGMLAAELSGWDAIRYTQRGVAPSTTAGPFTVAQHASDALAVLDHHGLTAVVVLGHSWGGYLAMQLAASAPARVLALVLLDTLGATGDGGLREFGSRLTARTSPEALTRIAELEEIVSAAAGTPDGDAAATESLRLSWPSYYADPASAPPWPDDLRLSLTCYTGTFESVAAAQASSDWQAALAEYAGPVEIVTGGASAFPADVASDTAAMFADATITVVAGAGHFPWVESPGCVAAALNRISRRLAAADPKPA
jgi:proline iminopeptidase